MKRRQLNKLVAAVALGLAAGPLAQAQDKPLMRILVGFPPGGSVDVVARLIAESIKT